eukprot:TRINITY_DN2658_c0_g1_i3.p1 TRINITY_DN2658_c0_g1~~TRINITY_DN2658_c0_g1_i3.p1  ORF type:complete len:498 (-),score=101.26 TRINITY_DN2658_c0_g1_i3:171-1664(-)
MFRLKTALFGLLLLLGFVSAQIPCPAPADYTSIDEGDTSWMLASSALVLLMTPGLGFFYGGLVRDKNVVNTIMLSYVAMAAVIIQWVFVGYSFAFGPGTAGFGSFRWGGLKDVGIDPNPDYGATVPHISFMNFQMMFAIITPALISGGIVERMKFSSFIIFVFLWSTICYDLLAHWMWSAWSQINDDGSCTYRMGWLRAMGAIDFAGGTVIHISSGFSALVAAAFVGKRKGFDPKEPHPAYNVPFVMLGAALLWFGWLGFNGGSAVAANGPAAIAVANSSIAAGAAFFTWLMLDAAVKKTPSAVGACSGAVVGLVVITPASGFIVPGYAIILGCVGAAIVYFAAKLKKYMPFDDSLDVFFVHGIGGVVGAFMTGLFATTDVNPYGSNGAFYGNPILLGYQVLAIVMSITVSLFGTAGILLILKFTIGLRASGSTEEDGLDAIHGEAGMVPGEAFFNYMKKFLGNNSSGPGAAGVLGGSSGTSSVDHSSVELQTRVNA